MVLGKASGSTIEKTKNDEDENDSAFKRLLGNEFYRLLVDEKKVCYNTDITTK